MAAVGIKKVFLTPLNQIYTVDKEGIGTIRFEGDQIFKWVQFNGITTVNVGDVVCYIAASLSATNPVVDGANTALGAGVAQAAAPSGSVQYGWIQIKGFCNTFSTAFGGSPAAGNTLSTVGATAPALQLVAAATTPYYAIAVVPASKSALLDFPF